VLDSRRGVAAGTVTDAPLPHGGWCRGLYRVVLNAIVTTDDDSFSGWATRRSQAARMAAIVDRVLRAGPYHGKRRPDRPKA
jgi:hypothetical protein